MFMITFSHCFVDLNLFLLKVGELLTKDSVSPNLQNDDGLSALHQVFFSFSFIKQQIQCIVIILIKIYM